MTITMEKHMTRTILKSNRQVNTLETNDGFFVLANVPRKLCFFPEENVAEFTRAVAGPFPLNDPRFSNINETFGDVK